MTKLITKLTILITTIRIWCDDHARMKRVRETSVECATFLKLMETMTEAVKMTYFKAESLNVLLPELMCSLNLFMTVMYAKVNTLNKYSPDDFKDINDTIYQLEHIGVNIRGLVYSIQNTVYDFYALSCEEKTQLKNSTADTRSKIKKAAEEAAKYSYEELEREFGDTPNTF